MSNAEQFLALAVQQIQLHNHNGAIEQIRRALALEPDNARAHAGLGLCHSALNSRAEAKAAIAHALKLGPQDWYVRLAAGSIACDMKHYSQAKEHLKAALKIDSSQAVIYLELARAYDRRATRHQVEPTLREGLRQQPDDAELHAALALLLIHSSRLKDAEAHARHALASDPEAKPANIVMGHICLLRHDNPAAREHVAIALRRGANDPDAIRLLCALESRSNMLMGFWWRSIAIFTRSQLVSEIFSVAYSIFLILAALRLTDPQTLRGALIVLSALGAIAAYFFGGRLLIDRKVKNMLRHVRLDRQF